VLATPVVIAVCVALQFGIRPPAAGLIANDALEFPEET
jgi:hypothetical protein